MNYLDYLELVARSHPDAIAVQLQRSEWTYGELLDDVKAAANLFEEREVDARDSVLIMLPNSYEFVIATLGDLHAKL